MLRSVLAIVVGFFVTAAVALAADETMLRLADGVRDSLGRVTDSRILLLMLTYTALAAVGGSYVTARLAPSRPMLHSMILGVIALVLSIAATVAFWNAGPPWYHAIAVGVVLPAAWLGATLSFRRHAPIHQSRVRSSG